jgi:IS30 family transposase
MDDPDVHQYVQDRLEKRWSPEQIAGRVQCDFPRSSARWLSRQTIYDWIDERAPEWQKLLRRGGRLPEKRGKLTDCVRIDGRPDVINRRRRYGDWEGDTVVGKGRRSALVTLVERKSGYARIGRVDSMKSDMTMHMAKKRMKDLPPSLRRSMTFDNGKEFAEHRKLTRGLGLEVYFADPYAAWQRGANENMNGLLRQFFPKGTDFTQVSHREVARVELLLNGRPRKRHDYRTPAEILAPRFCCN